MTAKLRAGLAGVLVLALSACSTLEGLRSGTQEPEVDTRTRFDHLSELREIDRRCELLNFYERAELHQAIEAAGELEPEHIRWTSSRYAVQARLDRNASYARRHGEARARTAQITCGRAALGYIEETRSSLLQPVLNAQSLGDTSEFAPLRKDAADQLLAQAPVGVRQTQGVSELSDVTTILDGTINQNAATTKGYALVFRPEAAPGDSSFDFRRVDDSALGHAQLIQTQWRIWELGEVEAPASKPAVGLMGLDADGQIFVLINSAVETGGLLADLRATLFLNNPDARGGGWRRRSWRGGAERFEGVRLDDGQCPAEACFVFPMEASETLTARLDRRARVYTEVYIGAAETYPIPTDSSVSERVTLAPMIDMLRPDDV